MKEIIANTNDTYTLQFEGWSVTANLTELEVMFNKCFNESVLPYLVKFK